MIDLNTHRYGEDQSFTAKIVSDTFESFQWDVARNVQIRSIEQKS